jgi:hypothetical protein
VSFTNSTVVYFFLDGVTTEGESSCGTLPEAEALEDDILTGRIAMGSHVNTRKQAEFEFL